MYEVTKFNYIASHLDYRVVVDVEDIIKNPPTEKSYSVLQTKLIEPLSASIKQRVRQLFSDEELGDHKPSQFLRHCRSL